MVLLNEYQASHKNEEQAGRRRQRSLIIRASSDSSSSSDFLQNDTQSERKESVSPALSLFSMSELGLHITKALFFPFVDFQKEQQEKEVENRGKKQKDKFAIKSIMCDDLSARVVG
jgi:hypothetical protein